MLCRLIVAFSLALLILPSPAAAGGFDPARRVTQLAIERLVDSSSWEQALLRAREALSRYPDDPWFTAVTIKSLRTLGYRRAAERLLTDSLRRHPADPSLLTEKGWVAAERGEWSTVLQILSLPPSDDLPPDYHLLRGAALRETGRFDEALKEFDRVPTDSPHACVALTGKGKILYRQKKNPEARAVVMEALKHCPDNPDALRLKGVIAASSGTPGESLTDFAASLARAPHDIRTIIPYAEAALAAGEVETARQMVQRGVVIAPSDDRLRTLRCQIETGGPSPDCIDIALDRQPDNPDLIPQAARQRIAAGKNDEALSLYDRLLSLRPADERTILERALLLIDMKRFGDAIDACSTIIEKNPLPAAYGIRGYARYLRGDRKGVDDDVTNALQLDRYERTALLVSILTSIDRKESASLTRHCGTMTNRYPGFLPGLAACARGYLIMGETGKGTRLAEEVIRRAPDREESRELSRLLSRVSPRDIVPSRGTSPPEKRP